MGTITLAPPTENEATPAPPVGQQSPWIYRPWIDLTVGCGAWSAPLLLAGFYFANSYGRNWGVAFYFLALLSNYPHFMATVYRAYHTRDEFEKYRLYTVHVALVLAHRLGQDEEAVDNWQRAVDVDPLQSNAQLYLAQALDQQGQLQAAARHYRVYLEIIAARHQKNPADTAPLLAALIKVADTDAAINHTANASKGYAAAAGFADKAGEKALQSLALVHLADLQEKQDDIARAAQSYQRALQLDAALADPRSAASDWFNYTQFLRKQKQPERYVFACLLHAENILQNTQSDELTVVSQARKESEARLGKESAPVRNKLDGIVAESLNLKVVAPSANKQ
jgi:tetratricopeptide (TPR) repeat protein